MSNRIIEILKDRKTDLFSKYPIKELALFGSYSRGDNTSESDIDILVSLSEPNAIKFIHLAHELEDILNNKVDLVSIGGISPKYFKCIEQDLLYV